MKNKILFTIGVAIALVGGILLLTALNTQAGWEYKGQEVFYTEDNYTQFKQDILSDKVVQWEVDSLTSKPPIIVKFEIFTEQDYRLSYGDERVVSRLSDPFAFRDYKALVATLITLLLSGIALASIFSPPFRTKQTGIKG